VVRMVYELDYSALQDKGMNQNCNVSSTGKRPFARTQIHASIQQHRLGLLDVLINVTRAIAYKTGVLH